ncbi:hypothetical protein CVT26_013410 [Gymnopilus dilepis]|uniref:MARVEL domain-containing protein n=1 Tax=Gymnopilus dilepis TaxID=231916 RepID=A0A409VUY4_9AGAR|nr:hypothetical protein CVT26_013410 [Gymnopilus dilepis]
MASPPNQSTVRPLRRRNAVYWRSSSSVAPLFAARLFLLFLAWCWGVISGASGINALVKSNRDKNAITKTIAGPGATVNINIRDVYIPGVFITVISFLIVFFTTIFIILTVLRPNSLRKTFSVQGAVLLICSVCLLVNVIVETVFVARRRAKVSATVGGVPVSQSVINSVQRLLGVTSVYRRIRYLRNAVIFAWITFLMTFLASMTLFAASSKVVERNHRDVEAQQPFNSTAQEKLEGDSARHDAAPASVPTNEIGSSPDPRVPQQSATSQPK